MAEFKVGDIVVAKENSSYSITSKGWRGQVIATREDTIGFFGETIRVTNLNGYTHCTDWVNPRCFYKVGTVDTKTEKETKKMKETTKAKFKVGDMVIGNASANRYGITTEGWIGKVVEVDTDCEDGDDIRVTGPGLSGSGVYVRSSRFDLFKDNSLDIKDVIFNAPATIVFWNDGTKTVVRCGEGEKYDPEKGLALCIAKKALGNKHDYYEPFKKWLGKYHKKESKKASAKKPAAPTTKTKKPVAKKTGVRKSTSKK